MSSVKSDLIADHRVVAIDEVNSIFLREVSNDEVWPIKMVQCHHLPTNSVTKPVRNAGVQQAITNPNTCANLVRDLMKQVEGIVNALLGDRLAFLERREDEVSLVAEQE